MVFYKVLHRLTLQKLQVKNMQLIEKLTVIYDRVKIELRAFLKPRQQLTI